MQRTCVHNVVLLPPPVWLVLYLIVNMFYLQIRPSGVIKHTEWDTSCMSQILRSPEPQAYCVSIGVWYLMCRSTKMKASRGHLHNLMWLVEAPAVISISVSKFHKLMSLVQSCSSDATCGNKMSLLRELWFSSGPHLISCVSPNHVSLS